MCGYCFSIYHSHSVLLDSGARNRCGSSRFPFSNLLVITSHTFPILNDSNYIGVIGEKKETEMFSQK